MVPKPPPDARHSQQSHLGDKNSKHKTNASVSVGASQPHASNTNGLKVRGNVVHQTLGEKLVGYGAIVHTPESNPIPSEPAGTIAERAPPGFGVLHGGEWTFRSYGRDIPTTFNPRDKLVTQPAPRTSAEDHIHMILAIHESLQSEIERRMRKSKEKYYPQINKRAIMVTAWETEHKIKTSSEGSEEEFERWWSRKEVQLAWEKTIRGLEGSETIPDGRERPGTTAGSIGEREQRSAAIEKSDQNDQKITKTGTAVSIKVASKPSENSKTSDSPKRNRVVDEAVARVVGSLKVQLETPETRRPEEWSGKEAEGRERKMAAILSDIETVEPNHQHNIRGRTISEYIKALEHPPELPSNMNNLGSAVRNWMHSTHDYMITMHNKLEELRKCLMISTCQHPKTTSLPEKRASEYQVNTSSSDTECPGESKEDPYRETNWRNGFEGWDSMGDISCGDWEQAPVGSVGEVTDLEYQVVTGAGHAQDLGDRVQTLFKENQRKWGKTSIGYVVGGDAKNGLHPPDSPAMKEQRVKAAEARMRRAGATTMGRNFNRRGFESSAAKGGQHARLLPRDSHANDEENEVPENANEGSRSDQNEAGTDTPRPEHGQDEVPCQDSDIPDLVSDNEGHAEAPKFKKTPIISGINDARRREEERREDPEKWYAGWDRWIEGRPNVSNENLQEFMEDRGVPREDIEKLLKGRKRGG